jgi:NADPH2:quinone reductase
MRAVVSTHEGVALREVPRPTPGASEVLVRVAAASLNRADLFVAAARTGKPFGMEWAGEVVECGAESAARPGQRVFCTGTGGFAEYAVTDASRTIPVPHAFSYEEATVLGGALQTMHDALVSNGRICKGEAVLIHGASTGVGLIGMQMAKHLGAAIVIGTSTSEWKRAKLRDYGADLSLDPNSTHWIDEVAAVTGGRGVDLVIDQLAGPGINDTMRATAIRGRIVNVGRLAGDRAEFDFDLHALRRIEYVGVTFRTRSVEEVRALNRALLENLGAPIAAGKFRLPIDASFDLGEAAKALARMEANRHFGKIVLRVAAQ